MYKVFMNDKPIIIADSVQELKNCKVFNFDEIKFTELQRLIESNAVLGVLLKSKHLEKDWGSFQKNFTVIEAAGGKVLNSKREVLFIYRFDTWDLPKGHIEAGENRETAAIREVEEECGITGVFIMKPMETTYHSFYFKNELRLKVTYWYLMKSDYEGELIPQLEEGITKVAFKDDKEIELALENTYPNIRLLF